MVLLYMGNHNPLLCYHDLWLCYMHLQCVSGIPIKEVEWWIRDFAERRDWRSPKARGILGQRNRNSETSQKKFETTRQLKFGHNSASREFFEGPFTTLLFPRKIFKKRMSQSQSLNFSLTTNVKGAKSQYFESFLRWPKLWLKCWGNLKVMVC